MSESQTPTRGLLTVTTHCTTRKTDVFKQVLKCTITGHPLVKSWVSGQQDIPARRLWSMEITVSIWWTAE